MIQNTLQQLGLREKEIEIYLEALKRGQATPATLSRETKLPRATVYAVIEKLIGKGFLTRDHGSKTKTFVPLQPDEFTELIDRAEQNTKRIRKLTHKAVDELAQFPQNTTHALPQIRFVQEEDMRGHLRKRVPVWNAAAMQSSSQSWWGFQDHSFAEHFKDVIDWCWEVAPPEMHIRLLSNESLIEENIAADNTFPRREILFWKKNIDFTASTWIAGSHIVMLYTREKPFYLIEIQNPILAHNLQRVFEGIWSGIEN